MGLGTSVAILKRGEESIGVELKAGVGGVLGWKSVWDKLVELGSQSTNSSGVSTKELLKIDLVLKTVWFESSESMCGELEEKLGRERR